MWAGAIGHIKVLAMLTGGRGSKGPEFDPEYPFKKLDMVAQTPPWRWEGRDWSLLGACWPASLAEAASPRSGERPRIKKLGGQSLRMIPKVDI